MEVLATGWGVDEMADDDGIDCDTVVVTGAGLATVQVGVEGRGCESLVTAESSFPSLLACCSANSCKPVSVCHPKWATFNVRLMQTKHMQASNKKRAKMQQRVTKVY